ncbi:MAG TPA: hypothetical protein VKU62_06890, partial [Thermoanaerobaculia bacterium]|nr:hypothetical protein [Thermoanaerobaculia bacterium]
NHFDEIGPLTIAIALGVIAAGCYVWVSLKPRAPLDEYVVLLGASIISADIAFIETQWHVLGDEWQWHFLLLAVMHAAAAYWFDSRAVLSLSIASLAAWFGIERRNYFSDEAEMALRAFGCAAAVAVWRAANHHKRFDAVLEQFAVNFAFWGAIIFTANRDSRYLGFILALLIGVIVLRIGFRQRRELFVMYSFVYTIIAIDIVIVSAIGEPVLSAMYLLASTVVAIVFMFVIHGRFQKQQLAGA